MSFAYFAFERPEGFRALSLIRKAIPKCGVTIAKTIFEIICAWQSIIDHKAIIEHKAIIDHRALILRRFLLTLCRLRSMLFSLTH